MRTGRIQLLVLACVILIGMALRLAFSYFSIINLPPSTDESILQLMANAISRGEQYPLLQTGQPYQFPLEAYLMSLFSESLPDNAFGARIQLMILGLITVAIFCAVAITALDKKARIPALALILIPSAYYLIHQCAYFMPQHTIFALLSSLIFLFAIRLNRQVNPAVLLTLITGILSGLSISNHLLAVSVVSGAFLIIVFTGSARMFTLRTALFSAGLLIGLIPYFLAVFTIEGAYDAITSRVDPGVLFNRIAVVISQSLPGAMGVYPPYFPDYPVHLGWGLPLRSLLLAGFLAVFISSILARLFSFYTNTLAARWPRLEWPDMFVIITAASIGLMAMNSASHTAEYRYLVAAVWSFPYLIGYVYSWRFTLTRLAVSGFTVALVALNIATSIALLNDWRDPEKIRNHADIPDLAPMLDWMRENDTHYCYASFWLAYRINYETSGRVTCAPVYNERFIGWPVPYKDEVDRQSRVVYLLSHTYGTKFSYIRFQRFMDGYGIRYQRHQFGNYFAYSDFSYPQAEGESLLPADAYVVRTNIKQAQPALLTDGNLAKSWKMEEPQQTGQFVETAFSEEQFVQRVDIVHTLVDAFPADSVRIFGKTGNEWDLLAGPVEFRLDRLRFDHGHPVLGELLQTIRFDPVMATAIRIELVSPKPGKPWTLSEIRIGVQGQ